MSRTETTRRELVAAIVAQGRANSTGAILLHAAIAERLGLNSSDLKCADLMISQSEDCTPGRLAELTGLSTGAITGVIDRLERAEFLVREHDPIDRRRVLLRLTHRRAGEVEALFMPLARGIEQLCENFPIAELAVVLRFMREIHLVTGQVAEQLRDTNSSPRKAPASAATSPRKLPARESKLGTSRAARRSSKTVARAPAHTK